MLNASDEIYRKAYGLPKSGSLKCVGERLVPVTACSIDTDRSDLCSLHNYSTRCDSLDLNVVNVPKLLTTTYRLKEQKNIQQEQEQQKPLMPVNGDLKGKKDAGNEKRLIYKRIHELEDELSRLRSQLRPSSTARNTSISL